MHSVSCALSTTLGASGIACPMFALHVLTALVQERMICLSDHGDVETRFADNINWIWYSYYYLLR